MSFATFYQRSIDEPSAFWTEQARRIDWHHPFSQVLDDSRPPFAKWFVDGATNLCHNAVDRWVATRGDQPALIAISTGPEIGASKYTRAVGSLVQVAPFSGRSNPERKTGR